VIKASRQNIYIMPFPAEYGSKPYQFIPSPNDNYTLASESPLARSSNAANEITSICFDSSHELFWTGNASVILHAILIYANLFLKNLRAVLVVLRQML
jgi:hypothetical protein